MVGAKFDDLDIIQLFASLNQNTFGQTSMRVFLVTFMLLLSCEHVFSVHARGVVQPSWPVQFQAEFYSPWKRSYGVYAVRPHGEVVMLKDGSRDHMCAAYHVHTSCSILSTEGWTYLLWPDIKKCCKCCSRATGCGPLGPVWLSNKTGNVEYLEETTVRYGTKEDYTCQKWAVVGLDAEHPNYYYQHVNSWKPCEVDGANYLRKPSEIADDDYVFRLGSITRVVNASLFNVPSYCAKDSFCGAPVCDNKPLYTRKK